MILQSTSLNLQMRKSMPWKMRKAVKVPSRGGGHCPSIQGACLVPEAQLYGPTDQRIAPNYAAKH